MAHIDDLWKRKDGAKTPAHGKGLRWRATWTEPDGRRRSQSFRTKDEAQAKLTAMDHAQRTGEYVSPAEAKRTLGDYWPRLERMKAGRALKTREMYTNAWNNYISPEWGHKRVREIKGPHVAEWLEGIQRSASAKTKIRLTMSVLLDMAVDDRVILSNPLKAVRVRPDQRREHVYLSAEQTRAFLEHMHPHYRLMTEALFFTGLRIGEMVELRVEDLDVPKRRLRVARGWANGEVSSTKTRRARSVPVPPGVMDKIVEHVAGKAPTDLVFTTPNGARVDRGNFLNRYVRKAAEEAGLPSRFRTHDARHTFASLAVSAGANVKVVQNAMGHADATTTLRTYAGTFEQDLDDVAERLGGMLGAGRE